MSYKTEFAVNNTDLQTILDMVNGLPDKVKKCKVFISVGNSSGSYQHATVTINGVTYVANSVETPDTEIEVECGTEIVLYESGAGPSLNSGYINIDGEVVASGAGQFYTHIVNEDTTIELNVSTTSAYPYGYINVTTSDTATGGTDTESTFTPTDSGGTTYKSKFADNNTDLHAVLDAINTL